MQITLSQDQYEKLLHLVFLGNWLANSYRGNERLEAYDKLAEDVMSFAPAAGLGFSLTAKIILSFIWIAPPAFFMGMPFPLGLKLLSFSNDSHIPRAWGINGVFSCCECSLSQPSSLLSLDLCGCWFLR